MKTPFLSVLFFVSVTMYSQEMTKSKLGEVITRVCDTIQEQNGAYKFLYKDSVLLCVIDETQNRMRIISPVVELFKLTENDLKNVLIANFHTALDVKYAISDDILWSVFIHPLKELSDSQVENAISQVYRANKNYGTTYSSTDLIFPGSLQNKEKKEKPLKKTKI